ncbi:D-Ala-D-Ala carboxypeptidase family metallohydrolase [Phytoactinopolyspora halotolerans]|uniref:Muramoyltetrapeptide carboxypeptidase n=1 Tax=Phytoactinopolyspora halotolerans TaxID=1981512 RepID=A0A6L9S0Z9_9ACTN|nr:D-Ala-D-Ala carboxypeptidase family metallohydrolase [Phytoactinopolyspora halotolerans]NED98648.1 muramoyltetrapeptide carboxypeptidase [Phytoactinopolyspora halotolerans]
MTRQPDSDHSISRRRAISQAAVAVGAVTAGSLLYTPAAHAYNWTRTLRNGDSGADVRELQIRVAGWAASSASQTYIAIDGQFGPATEGAVRRFQSAYGLTVNGVVGSETQAQLNWLESSDGSTRHFAFSEFHSKDGSGFSGGKVGSSTVKENVRRLMYKLEAVRRKGGNNACIINSGFRSVSHNANVGGASNSQHMYGIAADIRISNRSVSQVISYSKTSGFSGIIRYSTHTHVDSRVEYAYGAQSWYWST